MREKKRREALKDKRVAKARRMRAGDHRGRSNYARKRDYLRRNPVEDPPGSGHWVTLWGFNVPEPKPWKRGKLTNPQETTDL